MMRLDVFMKITTNGSSGFHQFAVMVRRNVVIMVRAPAIKFNRKSLRAGVVANRFDVTRFYGLHFHRQTSIPHDQETLQK